MKAPALLTVAIFLGSSSVLRAESPSSANVDFFEKQVRPLLVENCFQCHGNGKTKGGLSLTSRASILKGGASGPAVVHADPARSLLIQAVRYEGETRLGRMNRRRLDVEAWRDALLAASGELDDRIGGPPADISNSANKRRTLYGKISRHNLDSLLRLFDFPDPNITSGARPVTIVPLQQLFVLNSEFMIARARSLAAKLAAEAKDDAVRIRKAFVRVFGRPASEREVQMGLAFLRTAEKTALSPWEQYAQVLLSANEFAFVD